MSRTVSIYMRNPDAPPDAAFEPGALEHLVVGNTGRLLDPRRTPVSITAIRLETGTFAVRIDDFEDAGAVWEIAFEDVCRYQFALDTRRADDATVATYRKVAERFDQPLVIECRDAVRRETQARLDQARADACRWLRAHSAFLRSGGSLPAPDSRYGDEKLFDDLDRFMRTKQLDLMDEAFTRQFVSAPHSGEMVRGHRIVLAEIGLVPYDGKIPRDPAIFDGPWSRERRADHIIARLAFIHALFDCLDMHNVELYRGMSVQGELESPRNPTFVSSTISRDVAQSHFDASGPGATRVLLAQAVPIERVVMTYLESRHLNAPFREAEAVLLWDPQNPLF